MPPVRTIPPAKAVKTERTHEENQERAYIAASRRSDRSLEARVESARRASEIHKRRTGRSLRVTEQDVINEEMYEEEDDDLPLQYRRLTAHLQTGSADFNRRLAAYLTNHVAMRSALDQAITSSYAQTYPNAPQFAHNHSMYQSPFMNQQMMHNPAMFRHTPYPMAPDALMQPQRPVPIADPQQTPAMNSPYQPVTDQSLTDPSHLRRMSMPMSSAPLPTANTMSPAVTMSTPTPMSAPVPHVQLPQTRPTPKQTPNPTPVQSDYQQKLLMQQQQQFMQQAPFMRNNLNSDLTSPFSTALPAEAQMFLGGALDPLDPLTSQMMAGSEHLPSYLNYNSYGMDSLKQQQQTNHTSFDGLDATLAPSALDMNTFGDYSATVDPSFGLHFDNALADSSKPLSLTRNLSSLGAGERGTPGVDKEWSAFIENDWE